MRGETLLKKVRRKYSDFGSFAVWGKECNDLGIFDRKKKFLHTNSVVVGLNISDKIKLLENFHKTRFDRRLARLLAGTKHEGGYMTDLIKMATPKAKEAKQRANIEAKKKFEKEMKTLGINGETSFLILGNIAWKIFTDWFPKKFPKRKRLMHPSYRFVSGEKWHRHNKKILGYIPKSS